MRRLASGFSLDDLADEELWPALDEMVQGSCDLDVRRALGRDDLDLRDLAALLSPVARSHLRAMARRAEALTRRRFGRTVVLYAPLYLSNSCTNRCTYCGFARQRQIVRTTLDEQGLAREVRALKESGLDHVLLLTGEDPRAAGLDYIEWAVRYCARHFSSVGIEIYPLDEAGYRRLVDAGVDNMTIYQETYHLPTYRAVHPGGPKADFAWRLGAPDRAGAAGMRAVSIGPLLGLAPWRTDVLCAALHGALLKRRHWRLRLGFGVPRLRGEVGAGLRRHLPEEADLVQIVCALRLAFPDAELVVSTRERAQFRDAVAGVGVTRMSAGSRTEPGGYVAPGESGEQFAVADRRSVAQVARALEARGLEPVVKDFDRSFVA